MRWKPEVIIQREKGYYLQLGNLAQPVPEKDAYLVEATQQGITEDAQLVALIMQTERIDETAAAFGLAQFLLDYSDFIAPDTGHYIITN